MPTIIDRDQLIAGILTEPGIQSATWNRKTDKFVNCCVNCNTEVARHGRDWFCDFCNAFVPIWKNKVAAQGDEVTLQFRRPLNHTGTKNWTPAGGYMFNAATREAAEEIKRRRGLVQVCKMSESTTDDLRGTPRCIPIFLVRQWRAGGIEYVVRE